MIPRLKDEYKSKIIDDLQKKFSMRNKHMVPKFIKVVLNMGLGLDANDKKKLQNCIDDMSLISGQRPIVTKFKKSISNFKTRKGSSAGVKVTLRSNKMYEFIDRLVNIALPRINDFQGLSLDGFDNFGNYSFGIKEHIIFPEINFDKVDRIRGMDITIVTSGEDKKSTHALLEAMNFPFNKKLENKINRHQQIAEQKIKKDQIESLSIDFEKNPDILTNITKDGLIKVGFAAESEDLQLNAQKKLTNKKLDLIVANDITQKNSGFGTDNNQVTLIDRHGSIEELPLLSKYQVAHKILDRVSQLFYQ